MKKETIEALEEKLKLAMLNSDLLMLDHLLDDGLVFTNHAGQKTTKQMDLEAHGSGFVKIESIRQSGQRVSLFENVAVVTVLSEICGRFGETHARAEIHFTRVWQKNQDGAYTLIAAHSSLAADT